MGLGVGYFFISFRLSLP